MTDLNNGILGIDISKAKFDVALMVAGKIKKTHVFENTPPGFKALSNWLLKQGITTVAACMEATGCYGEALATYLDDQGFVVSVVNPAQIKSFSGAQLIIFVWFARYRRKRNCGFHSQSPKPSAIECKTQRRAPTKRDAGVVSFMGVILPHAISPYW